MNFNKDHYCHPEINTEWWYMAGIGKLEGEPVNYHVSFFRKYRKRLKEELHFAHFGINQNGNFDFQLKRADWLTNEKSHCDDTWLHFSIGDWDLQSINERFMFKLPDVSLTHIAKKQPAVHGPGYYSMTDMDIQGVIQGKTFQGRGWLDHEFHPISSIELALLKYHWFALQLACGIEIMLYVLPNRPAQSFGSIVFPKGDLQSIQPGEYAVATNDTGWTMELPKYGMNFSLAKRTEGNVAKAIGPAYTEGTFDIMSRTKIGQGFFEIVKGV